MDKSTYSSYKSSMEQRASRIQLGHQQLLNGRIRLAPSSTSYKHNSQNSKPPIHTHSNNNNNKENINVKSVKEKEYIYIPPASLKYSLWDSTPSSKDTVYLDMHDVLPIMMNIQRNALQSLSMFYNTKIQKVEIAQNSRDEVDLQGFFIGTFTNDLILMDRFDIGSSTQSTLKPTLLMSQDVFVRIFTSKNQKSLYTLLIQGYKDWTESQPVYYEKDTLFPFIMNASINSSHQIESLSACRLLPNIYFRLYTIPSIKIIPNRCYENILDLNRNNSLNLSFGFMTMDQARHVLLLSSNDSQLSKLSMIGIWVSGLTMDHTSQDWTRNLQSSSTLLELFSIYILNRGIKKMDIGKNHFLFCLYMSGIPKFLFYQVEYEYNQDKPLLFSCTVFVDLDSPCTMIPLESIEYTSEFCDAYKDIMNLSLRSNSDEAVILDSHPPTPLPTEYPTEDVMSKSPVGLGLQGLSIKDDSMNKSKDSQVERETEIPIQQSTNLEEEEEEELDQDCDDWIPQQQIPKLHPSMIQVQKQQWMYLTLLEQQLNFLKSQIFTTDSMYSLASESLSVNPMNHMSIATNTSMISPPVRTKVSSCFTQTNEPEPLDDSVSISIEMKDKECQVDFGDSCKQCHGTNFNQQYSQEQEQKTQIHDKDSPKYKISRLVSHSNESFLFKEEEPSPGNDFVHEQESILVTEGEFNYTECSSRWTEPNYSFATFDYLNRHGLN